MSVDYTKYIIYEKNTDPIFFKEKDDNNKENLKSFSDLFGFIFKNPIFKSPDNASGLFKIDDNMSNFFEKFLNNNPKNNDQSLEDFIKHLNNKNKSEYDEDDDEGSEDEDDDDEDDYINH